MEDRHTPDQTYLSHAGRGHICTSPTPPPARTDGDDNVDDGGDNGDDEDCDPSVPGAHTGCHSRSTVVTAMTSLTNGRRVGVASGLSRVVDRWLSVGHDR